MPPSIAAAKAGVTTGEWGAVMREVFGEYRAPTGVAQAVAAPADGLEEVRAEVEAVSARLGRRIKFLVGKPGLDGHSNGAEQIAVRARDAGMEVVYEGIRLTPAQIVNAAVEESVHVVGLSILSGSHLPLIREVMERMRAAGLDDVPVVAGGIIPDADAETLKGYGVARVYTPKDFELNKIMADIVALVGATEPLAAETNLGAAVPPGFAVTGVRQIGDGDEVVSVVDWTCDKISGGTQSAVLFRIAGGKIFEERWFVDTEQWKAAF
jgi:(2R)-ethylmalonyl-CoA mutase